MFQGTMQSGSQKQVSYSQFIDEVQNGSITEVTIQGHNITGQFKDGHASFSTYAPEDPGLVSTKDSIS